MRVVVKDRYYFDQFDSSHIIDLDFTGWRGGEKPVHTIMKDCSLIQLTLEMCV